MVILDLKFCLIRSFNHPKIDQGIDDVQNLGSIYGIHFRFLHDIIHSFVFCGRERQVEKKLSEIRTKAAQSRLIEEKKEQKTEEELEGEEDA